MVGVTSVAKLIHKTDNSRAAYLLGTSVPFAPVFWILRFPGYV